MESNDFVVFNEDLIKVEPLRSDTGKPSGILQVRFEADHDPIEFLIGEAQANTLASMLQSTLMDMDIERGDHPAHDERILLDEYEEAF